MYNKKMKKNKINSGSRHVASRAPPAAPAVVGAADAAPSVIAAAAAGAANDTSAGAGAVAAGAAVAIRFNVLRKPKKKLV